MWGRQHRTAPQHRIHETRQTPRVCSWALNYRTAAINLLRILKPSTFHMGLSLTIPHTNFSCHAEGGAIRRSDARHRKRRTQPHENTSSTRDGHPAWKREMSRSYLTNRTILRRRVFNLHRMPTKTRRSIPGPCAPGRFSLRNSRPATCACGKPSAATSTPVRRNKPIGRYLKDPEERKKVARRTIPLLLLLEVFPTHTNLPKGG